MQRMVDFGNTRMSRQSIKVGFAWQTLASDNLGVVALAEANLAIARAASLRRPVLHRVLFVRFQCGALCSELLRIR